MNDLERLHHLVDEVDATRRLIVGVLDELVDEILDRLDRIRGAIDDLNGDDPGAGSPTRMDRIVELSRVSDLHLALEHIADRICRRAEVAPPSVTAGYWEVLDQLPDDELARAVSAAARAQDCKG